MIYWDGNIENYFVKHDITTLHNIYQILKIEKKPMFLLLTFLLADQVKTCVIILKLVSLKFKYFTYFLFSNGQFYIPKYILTFKLKIMKK